ncbi:4-hydroxy-tetrahydrodipicolinate reductase [Ornithinimicrobium cavernae]|uniref:4-hydroxy-tetrahydrodipicolinate reductase n=1 Tax=Ornithinimicrobium cavernae TaxID=2666047 RepID=UPI001379C049|nr:dihydrodipicolinate reductase C-terminal domain-containing protein [Ornithinimicrobium cavernae]
MPLQIGIFGRGRLGSAIAAAAERADDLEVAWQVGREAQDLSPVDVALEVSHGDAVADRLEWARATGTALVIGTTGWDPALARVSGGESPANGILIAPNFSLTVALMRRIALALGGYAQLQDADLAVSEVHHTRKVDAPSGTALLLRDALARGAGREADSVQTASLRLGDVVGRHDVHLTSAAESITLTHEAHNREIYGLGALTAVRWLHGRRGTFTFDDLAAEVLDPLFQPTPTQKEEP